MTAPVLAAAGLALALLLRAEWRRGPRRRAGRMAATTLTVGALLALALEPSVTRRIGSARAVIVTEGASVRGARAVADSAAAARVFVLGDSLPDLGALRRRHPEFSELILAGWGLPPEELMRAGEATIELAATPLPEAILAATWPSPVATGTPVVIEGVAPSLSRVYLEGPGLPGDSVQADSAGGFALRFTPAAPGLATFVLRVGSSRDTGAVDVRDRPPPAVLIIESAPDFETSRLRQWLGERGGRVAVRTGISRARRRTVALNGASLPRRPLSRDLLREFDVLIIDRGSLDGLTGAERDALSRAVAEDGLGVLMEGGSRETPLAPPPHRLAGNAERSVRIRSVPEGVLLSPASRSALTLLPDPATIDVFRDAGNRPVAAWRAQGAGRVGVTAMRNTVRWLLEGDAPAWDSYWVGLLSALARSPAAWRISGGSHATVGRPIEIAWPAPLDTAVVVGPGASSDTVYLTPDRDSLAWRGRFWPREAGVHRIAAPGDTALVRVSNRLAWAGVRARERSLATRLHGALWTAEASGTRSARVPLPAWPFHLIFIGAVGWLWWERRSGREG